MANLDNFMRALAGFGAGVQGQGTQFLEGLRAQDQRTALEKITPKLMAGEITPNEYLAKLSQYDPSIGGKYALAQLGLGTDKPAALQEWAAYEQMTPEQQKAFLNMKRATQTINLGGTQAVLSPTGGIQEQYNVTPPPQEMPAFKGAQAAAEAGARADVVRSDAAETKSIKASDLIALTAEAEKILPNASSGYVEGIITAVDKARGKSTDASKADAQLKVIGAALTSNVPRFEGPQGMLDVELYKQAAGDVANTQLPYEDRLEALKTIKTLQNRYLQPPTSSGNSAADIFGASVPSGGFSETLQGGTPAAIDYREYFK